MNVIRCYVSTSDSSGDDKDQLCKRPKPIVDKIIVIGDLNAKVELDNTG